LILLATPYYLGLDGYAKPCIAEVLMPQGAEAGIEGYLPHNTHRWRPPIARAYPLRTSGDRSKYVFA